MTTEIPIQGTNESHRIRISEKGYEFFSQIATQSNCTITKAVDIALDGLKSALIMVKAQENKDKASAPTEPGSMWGQLAYGLVQGLKEWDKPKGKFMH